MLKLKVVLFIIWPMMFFGQITVDFQQTTMDLAVVARNSSDEGFVRFKCVVDKTGSQIDYDKIVVKTFRTKAIIANSNDLNSETPNSLPDTYLLDYQGGDEASVDLSLEITAETFNYSFEFNFIENSPFTEEKYYILNVVAGDVYIIQGQSNAEAYNYDGTTTSADQNSNPFIRSLGSTRQKDDVLTRPDLNVWTEAITGGNSDTDTNGFVGEWGLKLGKLIVDGQGIPVAIFNGSYSGKGIVWFEWDSDRVDVNTNNYERLLHRLSSVNLENDVKAIFWSQGENDWNRDSSYYAPIFLDLKQEGWDEDYQGVEQIYIFQTKSGCTNDGSSIGDKADLWVKESQRELAMNNLDITLISTTGLNYFNGGSDCHFTYSGGYEQFAVRLYNLLEIDFYEKSDQLIYRTPIPTQAAMVDEETLIISTTSNSLDIINTPLEKSDFILADGQGSNIESIGVNNGDIEIKLDKPLSTGATLSYQGLGAGENDDKFVIQSNGLKIEIACFKEFPIDGAGDYAVWESSTWLSGIQPNINRHVFVKDDYIENDDLEALDLTIRPGNELNFDFGSTRTITVQDKLNIEGDLIIGDTESLLVESSNSDAIIMGNNGSFKKIEKSALKDLKYDITYWSSSTESSTFSQVFQNVDPNRIFELDPSYENPLYASGIYEKYKHWKEVNFDDPLVPGLGYSSDGPSTGSYPMRQTLTFEGKPNNGTITIPIKIDDTDGPETGYDANLIGNPYPSAINADLFIGENQGKFTGAIYLWSHTNNLSNGEFNEDDYLSYNNGGGSSPAVTNNIGSGQGFMIIASQGGTITFNNDMRLAGSNDQFYKSSISKKSLNNTQNEDQKDRIWLKLKNGQGLIKEILVGFFPEATGEIDYGYDALSLSASQLNFYSIINSEKYAIQGLNKINSSKKHLNNKNVLLGLDTHQIGTHTISISKVEGKLADQDILLKDKYTGEIHDLKQEPYEFEIENKGEVMDRFVLIINSLGINGPSKPLRSTLEIRQQGSIVNLNCSDRIKAIRIFSLYGGKLYEALTNSTNHRVDLNFVRPGKLLYVKVITESDDQIVKKIINR